MSGLSMVGLTDRGMVRPENEDAIATRPEIGLAVLADGMGGHQAGEVASAMAVDVITRHYEELLAAGGNGNDRVREAKAVDEAIRLANSAIYDIAQSRPDYSGMGSTVVVAVFYGDHMFVGHVGDSRLYRFRDGQLEQLTEDHSVIQELLNRGLMTAEEARVTIGKNLVTRALGVESGVNPDVAQEDLHDNDLYLLCSDGLNDVLNDDEIADFLGNSGSDLQESAQKLIDLANARGGPDNISVILARFGK